RRGKIVLQVGTSGISACRSVQLVEIVRRLAKSLACSMHCGVMAEAKRRRLVQWRLQQGSPNHMTNVARSAQVTRMLLTH
ncbi:MAG: hypothetical protein ACKPKO_33885, partial [Candidatus Fonsibacter sp.]